MVYIFLLGLIAVVSPCKLDSLLRSSDIISAFSMEKIATFEGTISIDWVE